MLDIGQDTVESRQVTNHFIFSGEAYTLLVDLIDLFSVPNPVTTRFL